SLRPAPPRPRAGSPSRRGGRAGGAGLLRPVPDRKRPESVLGGSSVDSPETTPKRRRGSLRESRASLRVAECVRGSGPPPGRGRSRSVRTRLAWADRRIGFKGKEGEVALDPQIRKTWEELQKKFSYPVNAIGVKIDPKDQFTLKVWKDEGIDRFVKK